MGLRIIHDYGGYEGMKFYNDVVYPTVDAAVKAALESGYYTKFLIVDVIDWQATTRLPAADQSPGT